MTRKETIYTLIIKKYKKFSFSFWWDDIDNEAIHLKTNKKKENDFSL